uniref:Sulfotransferase domain-containing protein n=1 Tax=Corethron hystrix TaxID=216773 RepID=A0A7S1BAW9_9STRA|mmetsp:Transcript_18745/g.42796  ORF Transcript_18745/g.42796 Transcript_18745/m.42796 type:complete len:324 (+) Transcript_18745:526-1497(+)
MDHFLLKDAYAASSIVGFSWNKDNSSKKKDLAASLAQFHDSYTDRVKKILGGRLFVVNADLPDVGRKLENKFSISERFWGTNMYGESVLDAHVGAFSISSGGIRSPPMILDDLAVSNRKIQGPIISVGFPKTGTTSLFGYFHCGGIPSSHYRCARKWGNFRCGDCVRHNIMMDRPPFLSCGAFEVWAEINVSDTSDGINTIFLPQVEQLHRIHAHYPDATFVLTRRDPSRWVESVKNWHRLHQIFINTEISGLPKGIGEAEDDLRSFFVGHAEKLRKFVAEYPTHKLIEVDIDDPRAGEQLQAAFGIDAQCWGQSNVGDYQGA